jgi:hypothetical protein
VKARKEAGGAARQQAAEAKARKEAEAEARKEAPREKARRGVEKKARHRVDAHPHDLLNKGLMRNWRCDGGACSGNDCESLNRFRCADGCDYDLCGACMATAKEAQSTHPSFALTHFHDEYDMLLASEYKEQHQVIGAVHHIVIRHQCRNRVHITEEQATEFFKRLQEDAMKRMTHDGMLEVVHDVPATSQRMWTR